MLLKRLDDKFVQFDFVDLGAEMTETNLAEQIGSIKAHLKLVVSGDKKLQYKMTIPNFYDEHSLVNTIFNTLFEKSGLNEASK